LIDLWQTALVAADPGGRIVESEQHVQQEESEQELRHEQEEERLVSAERLTFFSDAVVAIAMTLLALELPVPDPTKVMTNQGLLDYFGDNRDTFLAFLISFLVISRSWTGHHHLFGYVRTLTPGVMNWNIYWLLMIVVMPFATKVLTGDGAFETRFVLYAGVQALSGTFFGMIVWSVARGGGLAVSTPPDLVPTTYRRLGGFVVAFLVSIPIAFVTHWAYVCWALIPVFSGVGGRILRRLRAS
jgi:uncharacterized membrane protein